jgi:hypothetical protein
LVTGQGPEPKKTKTRTARLFPQDPTGCLNTTTSRTHPRSTPQRAVLTGQAVASRSFTSVSANEHPTNTLG